MLGQDFHDAMKALGFAPFNHVGTALWTWENKTLITGGIRVEVLQCREGNDIADIWCPAQHVTLMTIPAWVVLSTVRMLLRREQMLNDPNSFLNQGV